MFSMYQTLFMVLIIHIVGFTPRPIETPDERSKRRICVVLTPDCGSFRWIRRHFRRKFFRPGNKNVHYKY